MAVFTTWSAALTALQNEIASGNFRVGQVSVGGKQITYRSPEQLKDAYNWVKNMAAMEAGTVASRVYAKQGGRG